MTDPHPQAPTAALEPDDNPNDTDSAFEGSIGDASYTTSLASSIKNYQYENGRRYHAFREGEYVLPNDEDEQDRLDLSHHIYRLLLGGALYRAPIENLQRVLDIGTGTGIWAVDFADENPAAQVIGNDLSPIQPSWTPPNCAFEVDDFESDWAFSRKFDFIHGRELEGSVRDYDRLFTQCFQNLRPHGYLEMQSMEATTYSDDGTHHKAENFIKALELLHQAAKEFGKDIQTVATWKEKMERAGFKNVTVEKFKLPQSPWPKDPKMKELGRYHQLNMLQASESYAYALFTRVLHWQKAEIDVLLAGVRRELKDLSIHLYTNCYFVYGQKPGDP